MAYKTFVVERTEDESTQTAGPATLNRADVPPLVKVFDDESDIVLSTLSTNEIVATKNTDYSSVAVVDRVTKDNLNPVTSNAVAEALNSPWEEFTPYSWSAMNSSYTSGLRRKEGNLYHYLIKGRTSGGISGGDYTQPDLKLYDTPPANFAFKWYQFGAGNEGAGRPFAYLRGLPTDATSTIGMVLTNATGSSGYMWIMVELYTAEEE